jgi:hypothetical protein
MAFFRIPFLLALLCTISPGAYGDFGEIVKALKSTHILVVQGSLPETVLLRRTGVEGAYQGLVSHFKALGLSAQLSKAPNGGSVATSAEIIKNEVNEIFSATGKRVFLIGDSYGGNKSLAAALRLLREGNLHMLSALGMVMSPLHGAHAFVIGEMGEMVARFWNPIARCATIFVAKKILGFQLDKEMHSDLSPSVATKYIKDNHSEIAQVAESIPVLTLTGCEPRRNRNIMCRVLSLLGHNNDGWVVDHATQLHAGHNVKVAVSHSRMFLSMFGKGWPLVEWEKLFGTVIQAPNFFVSR